MSENLLIVESPAKAKTLKKYLNKSFHVTASYGHVRDLMPKTGAVDPAHDFAMRYQIVEKNKQHLEDLLLQLSQAETIYLATDPDREGEAIAWHILEIAKERNILTSQVVHRVVFHSITKTAVLHAIESPRTISIDLINAQQARRALDYLVGFNLSPLLWKKVRRGLSAGRVQSPALRMLVERELEIRAFQTQEYWTIAAACAEKKKEFSAKLMVLDGEKLKQFDINNADKAAAAKKSVMDAAQGFLLVQKITKKQRHRNPAAPFTTSTLQQEAARKLGFSTQKTMRVAQQLYEGVDIGEGTVGLITYMRTDSVSITQEAITEIRSAISDSFGKDSLSEEPRVYKTKSKNAQEAHEAIRPTSAAFTPSDIKQHLKPDQFKLYNLIWQRTIASQMKAATMDTVAADLTCGEHMLRANGSVVVDPGFMRVYQEGRDDPKVEEEDDDSEKLLPPLEEGSKVSLKDILTEQHFTEPPPRFSEASLVKTLEEYGIGRPSTYASIISTLQQRGYAEIRNKRFYPTDVGEIVNKFLTQYFTQYVDYDFTAKMEDDLDGISRGEVEWIPVLQRFWDPFQSQVKEIEQNVSRKDVTQEALDEACPKCSKTLTIRLGKRGRFIGCSGYPDCDYTRSLDSSEEEQSDVPAETKECPTCGGNLVVKQGKYGKFWGCSNYPNCKHIEPLQKPQETDVTCPECKQHVLVQRKSRYGKFFYSCKGYPDCKYAVWNPPLNEACPNCHWPILTIKVTKRKGREKVCPQKECGYTEPFPEETP